MKSLLRLPLFLATLTFGFLALAPQLAAQTPEVPAQVGTISVPANITLEEVKDTIFGCLIGREWIVKEKSNGKVVGYLKHRSNEAEVTFLFDNKEIKMSCWGYKIDKATGTRKKPELPEGWLNNLKKDINKRLGLVYSQKV